MERLDGGCYRVEEVKCILTCRAIFGALSEEGVDLGNQGIDTRNFRCEEETVRCDLLRVTAENLRIGGRISRVNQCRVRCVVGIGRVGWIWCVQVEYNWRGRRWGRVVTAR